MLSLERKSELSGVELQTLECREEEIGWQLYLFVGF